MKKQGKRICMQKPIRVFPSDTLEYDYTPYYILKVNK